MLSRDLGVVTVDHFKVKWTLDGTQPPVILPAGVKVNIPKTVVGNGFVSFGDGSFIGSIDLLIVPSKLRLAAGLSIESVTDSRNRSVLATLLTVRADFPSPIVLAGTGLGIYGFNGLFAMHYKRVESPRTPGDSVSPALRWLERAGGEPATVRSDLWVAEADRWSLGLGVVLATLEGGFLVNTRGTFILELPGPRLLIFVKIQVLQLRPALGERL